MRGGTKEQVWETRPQGGPGGRGESRSSRQEAWGDGHRLRGEEMEFPEMKHSRSFHSNDAGTQREATSATLQVTQVTEAFHSL
jgi:hypothetical protein